MRTPDVAPEAARGTAPHWITELFWVVVFIAGIAWASRDIAAWVKSWQPAPAVHASARIQCPRPSELETLLVFVNVTAEGEIRLECVPAGPRGAYVKPSRGASQ